MRIIERETRTHITCTQKQPDWWVKDRQTDQTDRPISGTHTHTHLSFYHCAIIVFLQPSLSPPPPPPPSALSIQVNGIIRYKSGHHHHPDHNFIPLLRVLVWSRSEVALRLLKTSSTALFAVSAIIQRYKNQIRSVLTRDEIMTK